MTRPLLTRQDLGKDTAMPSHRLFVSGFAIISVLSVALPAVATELTPQQIYERAAAAVVLAIGHPEQGGLWTLTTGVISAEFEDYNNTKGKHVFQTETGLNRGNSGGPLLDSQGRIIGVNTAIARLAPDGLPIPSISFALKSSVARSWLRSQAVPVDYASGPLE